MNNIYINPLPIIGRVKEELKIYFNSNTIDDLMFSIWIRDCIDKMEMTYYPIREAVLDLCNKECEIPCDFKRVREAWLCATYHKGPIVSPHVFYYQTDCRINPAPSPGNPCEDCVDGYQPFTYCQTPKPVNLPDLCDVPDQYRVTHKVMSEMDFEFHVSCLLKPGNFYTTSKCDAHSPNRDSQNIDTFDIIGNKMVTSFYNGTVFLSYYADPSYSESGYPEIPNNDPFKKYVYHFLKYMTLAQIAMEEQDPSKYKLIDAKATKEEKLCSDAYINARNYAMAKDIYGIEQSIIRSYNKHNRFIIRDGFGE